MKKIIPFKKEIKFNTKISEITSISLEHTLNLKEDDLISGEFHISGEYKIIETSIQKESFDYQLPFDIALDSRYDVDNMTIDIDDFYYEVLDDVLKVNIDVFIDGDIIPEEPKKEQPPKQEEPPQEERCLEDEIDVIYDKAPKEILKENDMDEEIINNIESMSQEQIQDVNLFDKLDGTETFSTYHVYIIKETDTMEHILNTYNITKEQLEAYNTITEIKPGEKLIIPTSLNE